MRVFIALPLPPSLSERLAEIAVALKNINRGLSYVRQEGMHVTLFFLGEVDEAVVERLKRMFSSPLLEGNAIRARFSGLGSFPPQGNPRVIFAAIGEGNGAVLDYYQRVRGLLKDEHWPCEDDRRPFHPHVTLARNKFGTVQTDELDYITLPQDSFLFDRCVLFQSILKPTGAVYVPLAVHKLKV